MASVSSHNGRKASILLVKPPCQDDIVAGYPPLGLSTAYSYLKSCGYDVYQEDLCEKVRAKNDRNLFLNNIDLRRFRSSPEVISFLAGKANRGFEEEIDKMLSLLVIEPYDMIAFSVHSNHELMFSLLLSKRIKEVHKKHIAFGGPYISLEGGKISRQFGFVDTLLVGDIEQGLLMRFLNFLN